MPAAKPCWLQFTLVEGFSPRFEHAHCHTLRTSTLISLSAGRCKTAAVSPGELRGLPSAATTPDSMPVYKAVVCTLACLLQLSASFLKQFSTAQELALTKVIAASQQFPCDAAFEQTSICRRLAGGSQLNAFHASLTGHAPSQHDFCCCRAEAAANIISMDGQKSQIEVEDIVKGLLLKDLRVQCRARGISPAGSREALLERLRDDMLQTHD